MHLPDDFLRNTREMMGEELFTRLLRSFDEEPPATLRLNPLKCYFMPHSFESHVPWCDTGYYLTSRPPFTFDPLLHAGLYYVQEASSMFVHEIIRQLVSEPVVMLDLCAAPGGKSTAVRTCLPKGSLLISNEPVRQRAQVLSENLQKFGHRDVIVTNNYPHDFQRAGILFDVVLADVPCSGEGMFRRDEGAIAEWSPQNVEKCWQLQRSIVSDIWPQLKPGGLLVYSTCTFNTHENEENAKWICEALGAETIAVKTQASWNITGSLLKGYAEPVYRFIPGQSKGEGLFVAVMRKLGSGEQSGTTKAKRGSTLKPVKSADTKLLNGDFTFYEDADQLVAIPDTPLMQSTYAACRQNLKVLQAGITIGSMKGSTLIPAPSLALAACFNKEYYPKAALNYAEALNYLRGEAIRLPDNTPRGFVVVTYHGVCLGFVKNIGSRANNMYPQEWRIKSTHLPTEEIKILDIQ